MANPRRRSGAGTLFLVLAAVMAAPAGWLVARKLEAAARTVAADDSVASRLWSNF